MKVCEKSGGPTEGLEGVGRHSRRSVRGREALSEVWEALPNPPGGSEGVKKPFHRFRKGCENLPKVLEGSGGVGRPFQRSGRS